MQISLNLVLIAITLIYIFLILKSIRNKKLQISFSVFWLITGILLIIALLIPNLVENIACLLGFEVPANMIFCLTIFVSFYLIFNLTIAISKENKKNTLLIQEVSILKKRVETLEKYCKNNNITKK